MEWLSSLGFWSFLVILGVCGADGLIFGSVASGDVMVSGLGDGCVIEFSKLTVFVVVEVSPDPLAPCWLSCLPE
jgi:hypothetical protein